MWDKLTIPKNSVRIVWYKVTFLSVVETNWIVRCKLRIEESPNSILAFFLIVFIINPNCEIISHNYLLIFVYSMVEMAWYIWSKNIAVTTQSLVSHDPSEIILILWFAAQ